MAPQHNFTSYTQICASLQGAFDPVCRVPQRSFNFTDFVNSWLMRVGYDSLHEEVTHHKSGTQYLWSCSVRIQWKTAGCGTVTFRAQTHNESKKGAFNKCYCIIVKKIVKYMPARYDLDAAVPPEYYQEPRPLAVAQMDSEMPEKLTVIGDATQESDKSHNTIVTHDQQQTISTTPTPGSTLLKVCSTEPMYKFPDVVNRWMAESVIEITTSQTLGSLVKVFDLPQSLYDNQSCASNIMPFEVFVLGRYDIEMKFVVNANKFQCGKVICAAKFGHYGNEIISNGYQGALCRPHVILDLATNTEGILRIPFRYHRNFIRNVRVSSNFGGIEVAKYAQVEVMILSPLRTGAEGAVNMRIRPYYRIVDANFAGMSYRTVISPTSVTKVAANSATLTRVNQTVPNAGSVQQKLDLGQKGTSPGKAVSQMDVVGDAISTIGDVVTALPRAGIISTLVGAQSLLDQIGHAVNEDKPTDLRQQIFIPRPRMNFSSGVGLSDAIPMRVNPHAMTTYLPDHKFPKEPRSLRDIARIWGLRSTFVWNVSTATNEELWTMQLDPSTRSFPLYSGQPTPLEYVCGMTMFWTGTLELRFDFVSNSFHTGTVVCSIEFNRPSTSESECERFSNYTKTFHLGEQKSFHVRVPYIYDTVWRRSRVAPYFPPVVLKHGTDTITNNQNEERTIAAMTWRSINAMIKLSVVNPLNPIASAPQEIDVLVYQRAGPDFHVHGLCQQNYVLLNTTGDVQNFPPLPTGTYPVSQMDRGDKEDLDPTDNFNVGVPRNHIQTSDDQTNLLNILKRPVLLYNRVVVPSMDYTHDTTWQSTRCLRIPIKPPSRDLVDEDIDLSFGYPNQATIHNRYAKTISYTPQTAIMNLFQFHRGSQRYTFIIHGDVRNPIYVTHVPHSGTQYHGIDFYGVFGTMSFEGSTITQVDTAIPFPLYGSGLTTEMIIPSINPTMTFEVPFDTENNWTKTWESSKNALIPLTDKGDFNSGHLIVQCSEQVTMDVWWAAGDDFEIANFYGIPQCTRQDMTYLVFDDASGPDQTVNANTTRAKAQMDDLYPGSQELTDTYAVCSIGETNRLCGMKGLAHGYVQGVPLEEYIGIDNDNNHAADFRSNYLSTLVDQVPHGVSQIGEGIKSFISNPRVHNIAGNAALAIIPGVGLPLLAAKMAGKGDTVMDELSNASRAIVDMSTNVTNIVQEIMNKIGIGIDYVFGAIEFGRMVFDFLLDLINIIRWRDWVSVGVCFARAFSRIIPYACDISSWTTSIGKVIEKLYSSCSMSTHAQSDVPVDLDDKDKVTLLGAAVGIIGTILGTVLTAPPSLIGWVKTLTIRMTSTSGVGFINGTIRLVSTCFAVFQKVYYWMIGYVSPEAHALYMLSNKSDIVKKFISESQLMLNEANGSLFTQPQMRKRFWTNVMQAYQLHKLACSVPANAVSPHLVRMCTDVIKEGKERFIDLAASPVRFEPFVLCIEGDTALGKSFMSETIMIEMLKAAKFDKQVIDVSYVRVPGNKHWSGMRDQPVVIYDDWLNLSNSEYIGEQLSELYSLKSTAVYTPPMAHLEEKKIRINPLMVILLTNGAFPDACLANHANHKEAIYRRRDCVIHVKMNPKYKGMNVRDIPREVTDKFEHLEFYKYANVADRTSLTKQAVPYEKAMMFLCQTFKRYAQIESVNVQKRIERTQALYSSVDQKFLNLQDPFSLFYSTDFQVSEYDKISQNAYLPSEKLALEIDLMVEKLDEIQRNPTPVTIDNKPIDPFMEQLRPTPEYSGPVAQIQESWWQWMRRSFVGRYFIDVYADCSKCGEEHVPFYMCPTCTGTSSAIAYLCRSCCSEEEMHHKHNNGVPTDNEYHPIVRVLDEHILVRIKELKEGVGMWDYIKQFFYRTAWSAAVGSIFAQLMAMYYLVTSQEVPCFLRRGCVMMFVTTSAKNFIPRLKTRAASKRINAQSDEWEVPSTSTVRELEPVLQVDLNELFIHTYCKQIYNPTKITKCLHQHFLEHIDGMVYSNRLWIITTLPNVAQVHAPDAWCSERCYWKENPREHRKFMKLYLERNYTNIMNYILGMVNNPSSAGEYWKKIPYFVAPTWVEPSLYLPPGELERLTSETWWEYLSKTDTIVRLGKFLALITVGVGGLWYMVKTCGPMFGLFQGLSQSADANYSDNNIIKARAKAVFKRPTFQGENQSMEDVATQYVLRNMFTITVKEGAVTKRVIAGIGMYGHNAIIPKHYLTVLEKINWAISKAYLAPILSPHEAHEYTFSTSDFKRAATMDLAIFVLPASFNMFKDIRKFVATDADYSCVLPARGTLIVPPRRNTPIVQAVPVRVIGLKNSEFVTGPDGTTYEAHSILEYNYSEMGACGGILLRPNHQRPILAMHFAGSGEKHNGVGYSVTITQELLEEAIGYQMKPVSQQEVGEAYTIQQPDKLQLVLPDDSNVRYEACLTDDMIPFAPDKTKIRKSLIQGVYGIQPTKFPCILSMKDNRYEHEIPPLIAGCAKHGYKTRDFPSHIVKRNCDALYELFYRSMKPLVVAPEKLDISQACVGLPHLEYYDPLKLMTSAGFPYTLSLRKTKSEYITFEYEEEVPVRAIVDPEVIKTIHEKEKLRRQGIVPATIFMDTLKDERRPLAKLKKLGGTRVFCMSPQDYTISCRQNFLHFNAAFMAQRFDLQHGVGINVRSKEWSRMAKNLIHHGKDNIVTIDYSNFGPAFNAVVADHAASIFVKWTVENVSGVDELELATIMKETTQSLHQAKNLVYRQQAGAPSGSAFTTVLNSVVNQLYIMVAWDMLIQHSNKYQEYLDNVTCYVYGDDVIMSVSDKYINKFNAKTILELFAEYGIVATNASKTEEITEKESIFEATFLKHKFVRHPIRSGEWIAKIDEDSLLDVACWIQSSPNDEEATLVNAEQAIRQAYGHGKEYFDRWQDKINRALILKELKPIYISWEHLDEEAYG